MPQRKLITRSITCFLLLFTTIVFALARKDNHDKSLSTQFSHDLFESEEDDGILFLTADEDQERIIDALFESPSLSTDTIDEMIPFNDKKRTRNHNLESPVSYPSKISSQTRKQKNRQSTTTQKTNSTVQRSMTKPQYEYLHLPEVYRVNVSTKAPQSSKSNQHKEHLPAPNTKDQNIASFEVESSVQFISPWVQNFVTSYPHDVLLPVPRDFCMDNFNLVHIAPAIERIAMQSISSDFYESILLSSSKPYPIYREALRVIVQEDPLSPNIPWYLQNAAKALFLLIHQRYVVSPRGLDTLRRRFTRNYSSSSGMDPIFGRCPKIQCSGMPLLPYGDSDHLNPLEYLPYSTNDESSSSSRISNHQTRRTKRYCASCGESFYHWNSQIDGCAWGTTCCHLFVMVFGTELLREWLVGKPLMSHTQCEARIFGFRLHPSAYISNTQTRLWNK